MFNLKSTLETKLLTAFALAVAVTSAACTTPEVCGELGTCGGKLIDDGQKSKTWNVAAACLNQEAAAPNVPSLIHQSPTLAGEAPPRRTQANFCSEMVMRPDKSIKIIQPWFPALPLQSGLITYQTNGAFTASLNYFGAQEMDFAANCFLSQGFKIVPDTTASGPDTLSCKEFTPILIAGLETQPNISNFGCAADGAGGCACTYDLLLITGLQGQYAAVGNVINFYDTASHTPVASADYCVNGNTLDMSGYKRTFLFNQPALRSLKLTAETN